MRLSWWLTLAMRLFASTELTTRGRTEFLSPAYYTSMGFSVPAALGAQVAKPHARVVAIVGDGAFQMTGMELSSLVRRNMPVVVIVLDNGGYGTERLLHPGEYEFNEIHSWQYDQLPAVLGGGKGYRVSTEGEFDLAISAAWEDLSGPSIVNVQLQPEDSSKALEQLAAMMSRTVTATED